MKAKALLIGCLIATATGTEANAVVATPVLSMNDMTGSIKPSTDALAPSYTDSNVTVSGIALGSGLQGDNATGSYSAHSWTTGSSVITGNNDYFTFTLGANSGYEIDFTSFDFNAERNSKGPESVAVHYSLDGGSIFYTAGPVLTISEAATNYSIDLSGSEFQNLTGPIEFRLYGYDAANNGGKFGINSYSFNGTVTEGTVGAVPEPQSLALIGVGSLLMFGYMNRKNRQNGTVA